MLLDKGRTQEEYGPGEPALEGEIRRRAYEIYCERCKVDGHALDDWLRAETEILPRGQFLHS
jgi:Protein of unknown function (DUF2934)